MIRPQLQEFMRRMNQKSVAIIPSAREATRSNDTAYRFRQDSDFLYLTGFEEPESIAVIAPGQGDTLANRRCVRGDRSVEIALCALQSAAHYQAFETLLR